MNPTSTFDPAHEINDSLWKPRRLMFDATQNNRPRRAGRTLSCGVFKITRIERGELLRAGQCSPSNPILSPEGQTIADPSLQ